MHFTRRGLLGLATATVILAGCGAQDGSNTSGQVQVFASTIVWASVAEAVGGDKVKVTSPITSPEQDPHDYEATAQDKLAMSQSKVVVLNGGGYDSWAATLVDSLETKPAVVDAFAVTGLKEGQNEHVFYDLDTAMAVANQVAARLSEADPDNASGYQERAAGFVGRIKELRTRALDWGKAHGGAKVVSTESVAEYLLADLGLTDVTPPEYIRQSESQSGPSVAVIEKTRQLIGTEAKVLVVNGQTEDSVSKRLVARAEETGAKVVKVYETFPQGVNDYLTFIGNAVDSLTA